MNGFILVAMAGLCLLLGCAAHTPQGTIRDLEVLPQDARQYIPADQLDKPLLTPAQQEAMLEHLRKRFFAPWHRAKPGTTAQDVATAFARFAGGDYYDAQERPRGEVWYDTLRADADLTGFPNRVAPAITVRMTSLRDLPTSEPCYESFDKPGGGAPFDMLQSTALQVGAPLLLCHQAGKWAFVESPQGAGWIPAKDLLTVDKDFQEAWQSRPLVAITEDASGVACPSLRGHADTGHGRANLAMPPILPRIGTILPLESGEGEGKVVLMPAPGPNGQAVAAKAPLRCRGAVLPWAMTPANLASVANRMLGQPYGWGGLDGNRDCSSTTHDLFVPFGLWLPRNSVDQAAAGKVVSLANLSPSQKERLILEQGRPWLTLLRSPGHIMLYIGSRDGRAVMLHNFWGVKITEGRGAMGDGRNGEERNNEYRNGKEGRLVIARCVITTLAPGSELPNLLPHSTYLDTMESMILLAGEGSQ